MSPRGRLALGAGWAAFGLDAIVGAVVIGDGGPLDMAVVVCGGSAFWTGCGVASVAARDVRDER